MPYDIIQNHQHSICDISLPCLLLLPIYKKIIITNALVDIHAYSWLKNITYSLYSFEIRCDVTSSRLRTSLRVTIKRTYFAAIPYTTWAFTVPRLKYAIYRKWHHVLSRSCTDRSLVIFHFTKDTNISWKTTSNMFYNWKF